MSPCTFFHEHYFQAQKFIYSDSEWFKKIVSTKSPWDVAKMGRDRSHVLRHDWESVKDSIMSKGLLQKFSTHTDIKEILLSTGDNYIVENSPIDYYWGCGEDKSGKNMLGKLLVSIRNILRNC